MLQFHVMRYELEQTEIFQKWLESLKDRKAVLAITKRLTRLAAGNSGDRKQLGENLFELRFFIGPGYRVYYTIKGRLIVVLLVGGDKSTQAADIKQAKKLAQKFGD